MQLFLDNINQKISYFKQQLFGMKKREHFETSKQYGNLRTQMNYLANSPEFQMTVDTWPTLQQLNQLRRNYGRNQYFIIYLIRNIPTKNDQFSLNKLTIKKRFPAAPFGTAG